MKKKSVERNAILMLLIVFVVNGSATSTFPICYGKCMFFCVVFGPKIPCVVQCLLQCYIKNKIAKEIYYCNLGCAVNQCSKFGKDTRKLQECITYCERKKCHSLKK
ncbi:hypothetical protein ABFS82_12G057000 [Erythranthe guttata]